MSEWNTYPYQDAKPPMPLWMDALKPQEQAQVFHALDYQKNHHTAGVPGHSQIVLIAKLARMVDRGVK